LATLAENSASSTNLQKFACGLYNHFFYFWTLTAPECATGEPTGALLTQIQKTWGNFSNFQNAFNSLATGTFGSGWVWLCNSKSGLEIKSLPFQRNPVYLTGSNKCYPILGVDLWEHAYYFKYMASRDQYVKDFWNAVDWTVVEQFYDYFAKDLKAVSF
jgi:Fe-Mn family superoxide dismutase